MIDGFLLKFLNRLDHDKKIFPDPLAFGDGWEEFEKVYQLAWQAPVGSPCEAERCLELAVVAYLMAEAYYRAQKNNKSLQKNE